MHERTHEHVVFRCLFLRRHRCGFARRVLAELSVIITRPRDKMANDLLGMASSVMLLFAVCIHAAEQRPSILVRT